MTKLEEISALPSDAAELLEAVGYLDATDLYEADVEELLAELLKANEKLRIMSSDPTEEDVQDWKGLVANTGSYVQEKEDGEEEIDLEPSEETETSEAEEPEGDSKSLNIEQTLVNFEEDPEVLEMLAISPEAILLDPSLIRRHKLAVGDIPKGQLLTECDGEIEINVATTSRLAKEQHRESDAKRTGLRISRIRSFEEASAGEHHIKPLDKGATRDVVKPSNQLNAGVSPSSRRFVKGVMHPDPIRVKVSAFFAVLVQLLLVVNLIGIPWLLIHEYFSGINMVWWVVGLSAALVLSAVCYLLWGLSARCRVCGQRQFAPKKCLKNRKAHRMPIMGYILPTALHALFFKWFYCTYCGTAVRLKK